MSKPKRSGSMGPVFAKMLAAFEECEQALVSAQPLLTGEGEPVPVHIDASKLGASIGMLLDDRFDSSYGPVDNDYISPLIHRWGNDARQLRSAFKFKITHQDMKELANFENPDLMMRLPFEECVLVVNGIDNGVYFTDLCLFAEERYYVPDSDDEMPDWYADNGINYGDKFICVTASVISNEGYFLLLPAEYHATMNRPFDGELAGTWCTAVPAGTPNKILEVMEHFGTLVFVMLGGWIAAINNPNHAVEETQGLKPGVHHRAPRNKERRFYEHKMVTIDPLKARVNGGATGHGAKHRLHPVRGFWRRYKKSGKTVWVRPHWRGDKDLGVITHDYEVKHGDMQDRELHERSALPLSSGLRSMLQRLGILARKVTGTQATSSATDTPTRIPDGTHDRPPEGPSEKS